MFQLAAAWMYPPSYKLVKGLHRSLHLRRVLRAESNSADSFLAFATCGMEFITQIGGWKEWQLMVGLFLAVLMCEQISYILKGKHVPGPLALVPFLGSAISLVRDPVKFWKKQALTAKKTGLSWNVLFGKFTVYISDTELTHKVLNNADGNAFQVVFHPFGTKMFGDANPIFLNGEPHRDIRKRLAANFNQRALDVYLSIQERIARKHISAWLDHPKICNEPVKMRLLLRSLNMDTILATFVGPYMPDSAWEENNQDFQLMNAGTMSLPVDLPGFVYYKAKRAVTRSTKSLSDCARKSKISMANGGDPSCLLDFWMVETLKDNQEAEAAGRPPCQITSDWQIGSVLSGMLFAGQDAMPASLTWATALLEAHPQILEKVRDEQERLRPDLLKPITQDQIRMMEYTTMVAKEVLRFRPPSPFIPHKAESDFSLTETFNIPKGSLVVTSLADSCFRGFTQPEKFDPDRFSPERREDVVHKRNWLCFGAGSHSCIAQKFVINQLILFIALLSTAVNWTREPIPALEKLAWKYVPAIVPTDDCLVRLSARKGNGPETT